MKTKSLLITLFLICGFTVSVAQGYSNYGKLIGGGTYTCTGIGFQGLETKTLSPPFLIEAEIYENAVIHSGKVYRYVGNAEMYFISGRKYQITTGANTEGFLVDKNGAPHYFTSTTQNLPFVGEMTTTTLVMCNVGDTRSSYTGGNFNGGITPNYGGSNGGGYTNNNSNQGKIQYGYKKCNSCSGQGRCSVCHGKGMVLASYGQSGYVKCGACGGDGKCNSCSGTGQKYGILR